MAVDVHGGAGLRMAQPAGYGAHVHILADQQRGRCVSQAMQGNVRKLLGFVHNSLVVSVDNSFKYVVGLEWLKI